VAIFWQRLAKVKVLFSVRFSVGGKKYFYLNREPSTNSLL